MTAKLPGLTACLAQAEPACHLGDLNEPFNVILKVKGTQLCLTLCDPMDYTVHGILQARILEWVAFPSPGDLPKPGIKLRFLRWIFYQLSHKGSPRILEWVAYPFS